MSRAKTLLISVRLEHAERILSGEKTVELRRLRPQVVDGDFVVLYATSPTRAIVGTFKVAGLVETTPLQLWPTVAAICGISHQQFTEYFHGAARAFAIRVKDARRLRAPISLSTLRRTIPSFRPPQGYHYLRSERPRDSLLESLLPTRR